MSYIRDKAETMLKANVRLNHELRKAEDKIWFYRFVAAAGWTSLVVCLLTGGV